MLENNLFGNGYLGEVIVGVPKLNAFKYIERIAQTDSRYKNHIHFSIDEEKNDISGVIRKLQFSYNRNVVWGSGVTSCWINPVSFKTYKLAALNKGSGVIGMSYIWTMDKESSMRKAARYFNGIITNYPGHLYKIITQELHMTLAKPTDSIPAATSNDILTSIRDYKCDCDYHKGGCSISKAPPKGKLQFIVVKIKSRITFARGFTLERTML